MNKRRPLSSALLAASLLLAGCNAVPTSYEKWRKEQADRAKFAEAGVAYKSPSELRAEAGEMRQLTETTSFPSPGK